MNGPSKRIKKITAMFLVLVLMMAYAPILVLANGFSADEVRVTLSYVDNRASDGARVYRLVFNVAGPEIGGFMSFETVLSFDFGRIRPVAISDEHSDQAVFSGAGFAQTGASIRRFDAEAFPMHSIVWNYTQIIGGEGRKAFRYEMGVSDPVWEGVLDGTPTDIFAFYFRMADGGNADISSFRFENADLPGNLAVPSPIGTNIGISIGARFGVPSAWGGYNLAVGTLIIPDGNIAAPWLAPAPTIRFGDLNSDNDINLYDITLLRRYIARHFVHQSGNLWTVLDGGGSIYFNRNAADVRYDGAINLADIIQLRRYVASHPGIILGPQTQSNAQSGFAVAGAMMGAFDAVQISAAETRGVAGEYVYVDIMLDANPGIIGLQLDLHYDTDALTFAGITAGSLMPLPVLPRAFDGLFSLAFEAAGFGNLHGTGVLATARFRISDYADAGIAAIELDGILAMAGSPDYIVLGVVAVDGFVDVAIASEQSEAAITASNAVGIAGNYVDIIISMDENSGLSALGFELVFDADVLQIIDVLQGEIMPMHVSQMMMSATSFGAGAMFGMSTLFFSFAGTDSSDTIATGNLAIARFRIRDGAALGISEIVLRNPSGQSADNAGLNIMQTSGFVVVEQ